MKQPLWLVGYGGRVQDNRENLWYFRYTFPPIVMEVKVGTSNNNSLSNTAILSFSTFMIIMGEKSIFMQVIHESLQE